jgi:hypothetical protein
MASQKRSISFDESVLHEAEQRDWRACIAVGVSQRVDVIATSDPDDLRKLLGPSFTILTI